MANRNEAKVFVSRNFADFFILLQFVKHFIHVSVNICENEKIEGETTTSIRNIRSFLKNSIESTLMELLGQIRIIRFFCSLEVSFGGSYGLLQNCFQFWKQTFSMIQNMGNFCYSKNYSQSRLSANFLLHYQNSAYRRQLRLQFSLHSKGSVKPGMVQPQNPPKLTFIHLNGQIWSNSVKFVQIEIFGKMCKTRFI